MSLESQGHTQIQTHTHCVPSLSLCCSVQRQGFEDALPLSNHTTNLLGYTPMHANPCLPEDSHMQPSHITIISAVNSSYVRESFCPWLNTGIYRGGFNRNPQLCSHLCSGREPTVLLAFPGRGLCSSFCTVSRSSVFTACSSSWSFPIFRARPLYSSILRYRGASPRGGYVYTPATKSLLPPTPPGPWLDETPPPLSPRAPA